LKFRRFLARHVRGSRLLSIRGARGARQRTLSLLRDRPLGPYRGPLEEHVLVVVEEGIVKFERDGQSLVAETSDALLIGRGEAGRLTFFPDRDSGGLTVEITTFDERSIGKKLRTDAALESAALMGERDVPGAFHFRRFYPLIPKGLPLPVHRFHSAIAIALHQYGSELPEFFREHFYRARWDLLVFLERFATCSEGAKRAAREYNGGEKQLRRDCLLNIGRNPAAILRRRRCELAYAWLRSGNKIEDVAKVLGFSSNWDFECEFAGVLKMRCRDVEKMPLLQHAEPEELVNALTPFWWEERELVIGQIPQAQVFGSIMDPAMEDRCIAHERHLQAYREQNRQKRAEVTEELREKAADFFAMKSTGAEIIVPIFKSAINLAQAA